LVDNALPKKPLVRIEPLAEQLPIEALLSQLKRLFLLCRIELVQGKPSGEKAPFGAPTTRKRARVKASVVADRSAFVVCHSLETEVLMTFAR